MVYVFLQQKQNKLYEIWGYHSGIATNSILLRSYAIQINEQ